MDVVRFELRYIPDEPGDRVVTVVGVSVNERDLAWLVGKNQRPLAADDSATLAGEYIGLPVEVLDGPPEQHFRGSPNSHLHCGPREKTVPLGCECLEPGCWPLMARIRLGDDVVTWSGFEQPHRGADWGYAGLEFTFERKQYEDALRAMEAAHPRLGT